MLAAAASKVSLAKQAMQQLTAELAELTGPGGQPQPAGGGRAVSPAPRSGPGSAFSAASQQQLQQQRSSSYSGGGLEPPPPQQQGPGSYAWMDYRHAYHQTRGHTTQSPHTLRQHSGSMEREESWGAAAQRQGRLSTGSLTPSGMLTPDMSPRAAAAAAAAAAGSGDGMRLRGMFSSADVRSTEELVALYANSGHSSEKKLVSLLEEALAAAHAEKVCAGPCVLCQRWGGRRVEQGPGVQGVGCSGACLAAAAPTPVCGCAVRCALRVHAPRRWLSRRSWAR
jgi:hypothetical protein